MSIERAVGPAVPDGSAGPSTGSDEDAGDSCQWLSRTSVTMDGDLPSHQLEGARALNVIDWLLDSDPAI
ncbi:MAG TPA: hypothetical protein VF367_00990, partial [Candidatus Limnocylindria bacterium]